MNIDKIAAVIERDAWQSLPDLKDSLAEMKAGKQGRVYIPEQLSERDSLRVLQLLEESPAPNEKLTAAAFALPVLDLDTYN